MLGGIFIQHIQVPWEDDPTRGALLQPVLNAWKGTEYQSGASACQQAADCIGSVFGVLAMAFAIDIPNNLLPPDVALHSPDTARAAMRQLLRAFPHTKVETARPGDVLVFEFPSGGPGHVGIVGPQRNTFWESNTYRFDKSGWASAHALRAVYRPEVTFGC